MHGTLPHGGTALRAPDWRETATIVCVAGVFGTLAFASIELTRHGGRIAAVWLPNALAVAFLLRFYGRRSWPVFTAIFAGNVCANLAVGDPLATTFGLSLANVTEIAIAVALIRRWASARPSMTQLEGLLAVVGAAGVAPAASATIAAAVLSLQQPPGLEAIALWYLADGLGILILVPICLILIETASGEAPIPKRSALEWAGMLAFAVIGSVAIFMQTRWPLLFLADLIMVSFAFRLGLGGTAIAMLVVSTVASIGTAMGTGPVSLVHGSEVERLLVLQTFLASAFTMSLPVSAVLARRERMAKDVLSSRRELALLADNITDAVLSYDLHGLCTYASPSVRNVLGRPPEDFIGASASDKLHPDAREKVTEVERGLVSGEIDKARFTYRRLLDDAQGRSVYIEADCAVAINPRTGEREGIVVSARDVSERVRLESDLVRARRHAEQAARAKAQFLANMSHEIRTPMNGVLGFADLLRSSDLPPEAAEHARMIASSGRSMMAILNDILDVSKIEAGQMTLEMDAVDVVGEIEDTIALQAVDARAKGIDLAFEGDPNMPPAVVCDPLRLRQMLLNLVGNAVKFTDEGVITVELSVGEDTYSIAVEDTGPGIAPERAEAIFDPFVQAEENTTRRYGGTGLGLAITRNLAEMLGGSLTLESELGRGSVFTLTLPLERADRRIEDRPAPAPPPAPAFSKRSRVLLAEDHDINRLLVAAMLDRCGLSADIARDGEEAIGMVLDAEADETPYDLVLMDVQMPVCDGYEATRAIRLAGVGPDALPIVALTANAFPEDIADATRAGMQAHLAKPLVFDRLLAVLNRWLPHRIVETMQPSQGELGDIAARWRQRRGEALDALEDALQSDALANVEGEALARTMHKLAGTAGMFGEAVLGERAGALERAIRSGVPTEEFARMAKDLLRSARQ